MSDPIRFRVDQRLVDGNRVLVMVRIEDRPLTPEEASSLADVKQTLRTVDGDLVLQSGVASRLGVDPGDVITHHEWGSAFVREMRTQFNPVFAHVADVARDVVDAFQPMIDQLSGVAEEADSDE